ncbi:YhgE/Pip domain-containing protein [Bacillus sp. AGMB 02131]|uniref:YhgE/Pip domain-containing protein n=1 Tax=Peribacillus faecalis TaxID=2772559 RepID=A0A927CWT8_9BACI|nr:YhgE/Pip domain-containing protein [Peribacillus faecalis]MBD3109078.1 YhgE/Pip domain-containing protein [Peribacillus faecalis]
MNEFSSASGKKGMRIALITVLLVPFIYAAIMLTASWGPYDNLSNLPVAVVNEDKGAMSGSDPINAGEDLVANLKESKSLGFDFVSKEEAEKGLEDLKYYMVIEIPEDFSENITSVLTENPTLPELKYTKNEGLHFMASQVTNSATNQIREQLAANISQTYAQNLFSQLNEIASGFKDGAEGSGQINEGASKLKDGTSTILESLQEKSPDISKLADGSQQLKNGTSTLLQKVHGGTGSINQLAGGSQQLKSGTSTLLQKVQGGTGNINQLADGSSKLKAGTSQILSTLKDKTPDIVQLAEGSRGVADGSTLLAENLSKFSTALPTFANGAVAYANGANDFATGATQLTANINGLPGQVSAMADGAGRIASGSNGITNGLKALLQHPTLGPILSQVKEYQDLINGSQSVTDNINGLAGNLQQLKGSADRLVASSGELTKGASNLQNRASEIKGGADQFIPSANTLAARAKELSAGAVRVADGNASLNQSWGTLTSSVAQVDTGLAQIAGGTQTLKGSWSELSSGVKQIDSGMTQVSGGTQTLKGSWSELSSGVKQIDTGMTQVNNGNQTVKEGWSTLTDGVQQVDDGIAQIEDGSGELASGLQGGAEKVGAIQVNDANIKQFASPVGTAGETINEFPLYRYANAPYVLSLGLFVGALILTLFMETRRPDEYSGSAFAWYGAQFAKMAGFAAIQAVIMSVFALFFLKIGALNSVLLILFAVIAGVTFLAIAYFLVALAGNIGRFIAVAFLVLQLSTTGSSLPIEMLPEGLRNLSNFLPMRYSIDGFRGLVSLNDTGFAWSSIMTLCIFLLAAVALIALTAVLKNKNSASNSTSFEA